jgi:hypothetical protein
MCFGNNNPAPIYMPYPPQPVQPLASVKLTDEESKETDAQTRARFKTAAEGSKAKDANKNVLGTQTDKLGS